MMARHRTYFREWRKYRGHTLEVAAELSGMSVGNISAMERGAQSYTQDGLEALANAYRCEPGQLLSLDPEQCDIWSIWEIAGADARRKIVEIARIIVKRQQTACDAAWWLFQIAIMTLIIGSNGAYHWVPKGPASMICSLGACLLIQIAIEEEAALLPGRRPGAALLARADEVIE